MGLPVGNRAGQPYADPSTRSTELRPPGEQAGGHGLPVPAARGKPVSIGVGPAPGKERGMSSTDVAPVSSANAEAVEAWDGPLFDRFVTYRHIVVTGLTAYGDEAMRVHPPDTG